MIGYRGVTAIISGEKGSPAPSSTTSARHGPSFPRNLADAYAMQFGQVYLNFSKSGAAQRAQQLAAFLPSGGDAQLGWNGSGSAQLQFEQVAGTRVQDAHHAVVTILARVNGQLLELGVPIYATHARLVVNGEPALLPPPARASIPASAPVGSDSAAQADLMRQLPSFFSAYATGNQVTLGRFLAPGSALRGLKGAVTFQSIASVSVPPGGNTRHIDATILWGLPANTQQQGSKSGAGSATLQMTYALTVVKQNGTWYVKTLNASTQSPGAP
ncbi:MAG TPA: conjugal transfer protein [Streptosporangiaceae bacterium]|nr:conjugal transfer protein [Streptosporangiaceae bacterium]